MFSHELRLQAALELATLLAKQRLRLVLAESCTVGSVAAALGTVPGISEWLCGSLVVYRNASKINWLGVPRELLDDPGIGPVSAQITLALAQRALRATDEADLAVAITGHIGPGCTEDQDGRIFFALFQRKFVPARSAVYQLTSPAPQNSTDQLAREQRLIECSTWILNRIRLCLYEEDS